jgi:superfamily II RNA helicase
MKFKEFTLDPFQEQAIEAIDQNNSVVVSAPTGSGKTLIADYIIYKNRSNNKRIIYTAPIKALSNQKFKDFSKDYGEDAVGLMTGDIVINPHAKILIMTTEIYRNMVIAHDSEVMDIAYVIFDEVHYINDIERGYVWEESIIYSLPNVRFLCLSATIPNAKEFSEWIQAIKKHPVKTVTANKRNVPLDHLFYDYELGLTTLENIKEAASIPRTRNRKGKRERIPEPSHTELIKDLGEDKLPCFFFSFSRRDCQNKAQELAKANLFQKDFTIINKANQLLANAPPEINRLESTKILKSTLSQGIAFHHAGLLPVIKEMIEELFSQGLIKVLYATETFAVGINMPAKTVCFNSLRKYDGYNFRYLNTKEYFQIAGRAGRRGKDTIGYAVSLVFRPNFSYQDYKRITSDDIEPIESQFKLSINTTLNLVERHSPEEIEQILRLSFYSYQKFGRNFLKVPAKIILARYYNLLRLLNKYGYLKNNKLTEKGYFAARIFADEITIGEIFATDFIDKIEVQDILLILASIVYEPREADKFYNISTQEPYGKVRNLLNNHPILCREKKFLQLRTMTCLAAPLYDGKNFFDVLKMTNLLEGDLIRVYAQILDRLGQIRKASSDYRVEKKIKSAEELVRHILEGIYLMGE